MNIKKLCKEKAVLKRKTGDLDEYGKVQYEDGVEIKCLIDDKIQLVITPQGQKLINLSSVLTVEHINVGDLINDRPVLIISVIKDKNGKYQGMEAFLE